MTVLIVLVTLVAVALLARWAVRRAHLFLPSAPLAGHDGRAYEHQLADLRALRSYRESPQLFP